MDDGTTVLVTTQYLEEAHQLADRITVIDAGRVVREGTSDELKTTVCGAVIELHVQEPDRCRAIEALAEFGAYHQVNGAPVLLPAAAGVDTLRNVLLRLDAVHVTPNDLSLRKPTLDDVFLSLTGHTTSSDPKGSAAPPERPASPPIWALARSNGSGRCR